MKYIDTSALVKYYGNPDFEKGADKIIELITKAKIGEITLMTSIFTIGEAISAFDRWVRTKRISEEEFLKIITKFVADIEELNNSEGLIVKNISSLTTIFCIEYIIKHHIPINDTIHLYTALITKPKIEEFICSDELLNKAVENEGLKVFNPENSYNP